jgi:hypothetical protein
MLKQKLLSKILNENYTSINHTFRRHCHDFISYEEEESNVKKEIETDTLWLKSEEAIQMMKLGRKEPTSYIKSENMHEHISQRGYISAMTNPSTERVLSSCMTYPLTLAYAQKLLYPNLRSNMKVLIIGARAESNLPTVWWLESLYSNNKSQNICIKMIGPALQKAKNNESNCRSVEWLNFEIPRDQNAEVISNSPSPYHSPKPKVEITVPYDNEGTKLLHENKEMMELLQWADMFVMYNPGKFKFKFYYCENSTCQYISYF